jgi:L-rhamnose mutarotase
MQKINHPLELDMIDEHRKEDCINYSCCLDEASTLLWASFSCKGCTNYCKSSASTIQRYERNATPLAWEV